MSIADTIEDTFAARNPATMAAAIVSGVVLAIADSADPQTITTRTSGGAVAAAVEWQGKLWSLDPDDSTTPHDEITCIRTIDSDGYFTDEVRMPKAVKSRSVTTPPDGDSPGPNYDDAWLVPAAATDGWAAHEDEIAVWTARGWVYKAGAVGDIVLVEDEGSTGEFIHFNNVDAWEDGLPGNLVALSVRPSALLIRSWNVENQTTAAPPATGPAGEHYIIGAGATGAWSGQDKKIAWRPSTDAAFVITTPFTGEEAYDKNLGTKVKWSGTAWAAPSSIVQFASTPTTRAINANAAAGSGGAGNIYDYSATAPTTSKRGVFDDKTLAFQAKKSAAKLIVAYDLTLSALTQDQSSIGGSDGAPVLALFRDAETTALDWVSVAAPFLPLSYRVNFEITAIDTLSHTYKMRLMAFITGDNAFTGIYERRRISIAEIG